MLRRSTFLYLFLAYSNCFASAGNSVIVDEKHIEPPMYNLVSGRQLSDYGSSIEISDHRTGITKLAFSFKKPDSNGYGGLNYLNYYKSVSYIPVGQSNTTLTAFSDGEELERSQLGFMIFIKVDSDCKSDWKKLNDLLGTHVTAKGYQKAAAAYWSVSVTVAARRGLIREYIEKVGDFLHITKYP